MAQTTTITLLPQTVYSGFAPITIVGNAQPAASYYLGNKDLQTVAIKLTSVTGNIVVEASLATTPSISDWFTVFTLNANLQSNVNSTTSTFSNIVGNFVHLRASVQDFTTGTIDHVKVSY